MSRSLWGKRKEELFFFDTFFFSRNELFRSFTSRVESSFSPLLPRRHSPPTTARVAARLPAGPPASTRPSKRAEQAVYRAPICWSHLANSVNVVLALYEHRLRSLSFLCSDKRVGPVPRPARRPQREREKKTQRDPKPTASELSRFHRTRRNDAVLDRERGRYSLYPQFGL